ncbi:cell division inhibitor [Aeromonas cavernicola]|nr:cell division inhibitor [Aeromonas cavernicola]
MTALTDASQLGNGWLVLIAPPTIPAVALFQQQGIDPKRVLIVHSRKIKNWQQTLERSVSSGHCAAVFTWLPDQIALDKAKLQQISHQAGVPTYFFGTVPMGEVATLTPHLSYGEQDIYLNH